MPTLTHAEVVAALQTLKLNDLTFGDCVKTFAATTGDETTYAAHARDAYHRDGELEIDSSTVVSPSSDLGAYVMAWRWVLDREIWDGPVDSDGEPCRLINHYHCDDCGEEWEDQWSCACNDECPTCGHEIEPHESQELGLDGEPLAEVSDAA